MPELPEVETTLNGIKPPILQQKIADIIVRHPRLRWPIPTDLSKKLVGKKVQDIKRRAKYLLFIFDTGTLILHLGMSGRLQILSKPQIPNKHDHVDIVFANKKILRFTDPRRFGALLWTEEDIAEHVLIKHIGPEPLDKNFTGNTLWKKSQGRKVSIKSFIMNAQIVAGVGNIYATEALFAAGIHPNRSANKVTRVEYEKLVNAIKLILRSAIKKGGTTLKDFTNSNGSPGYFQVKLKVYGHANKPCPKCHATLKHVWISQRSTVYCDACQH